MTANSVTERKWKPREIAVGGQGSRCCGAGVDTCRHGAVEGRGGRREGGRRWEHFVAKIELPLWGSES